MSINLIEELDGRLVSVEVSGKLAKIDYEIFAPEIDRLIMKNGKIDMLVIMHDFHGWDAGALWEDIKFDLKHFGHIRHLAIVGETKWEKLTVSFCKPFTKAKIKYFEQSQVSLARLWVQLKDEKALPILPHTKPAAFGIYTRRERMETAIERLKHAGFTPHEISALLPHKAAALRPEDTKRELGAEVGAGTGAVVGGVLGWLAGAGLLSIPGLAAAIIGGPIVTAFVAAATLASVGGVWGGLVGLGIPEKEGRHYEGRLHKGDYLLSVHCDEPDRIIKAREILDVTGAEDIHSRHGSAAVATVA